MYYYEPKNKLPHIIILDCHETFYYYSYNPPIHHQRKEWCNKNIGVYGKDWHSSPASMWNGRKINLSKSNLSVKQRWSIRQSLQYSFKTKENALLFNMVFK